MIVRRKYKRMYAVLFGDFLLVILGILKQTEYGVT